MKRIVLGDVHGHLDNVINIIKEEDPDSVILLGDYCDSFVIKPKDILKCWNGITKMKKEFEKDGKEFVMLIGNHDWHYVSPAQRYSGYNPDTWTMMHDKLREAINNKELLFIYCDKTNKTLYSHAGVTTTWLKDWTDSYDPADIGQCNEAAFNFSHLSFDMYGDSKFQGPLWVRPGALLGDLWGADDGWTQVVGHTRTNNGKVLVVGDRMSKEAGGRYKDMHDNKDNALLFVVDTLPFQYLLETYDDSGVLVSRDVVSTTDVEKLSKNEILMPQ